MLNKEQRTNKHKFKLVKNPMLAISPYGSQLSTLSDFLKLDFKSRGRDLSPTKRENLKNLGVSDNSNQYNNSNNFNNPYRLNKSYYSSKGVGNRVVIKKREANYKFLNNNLKTVLLKLRNSETLQKGSKEPYKTLDQRLNLGGG